jgi:hypothetical protein
MKGSSMAAILESDLKEQYIPPRKVRERYGVESDMSIRRRIKKGFPRPYKINGRNYWKLSELVAYERSLVAGM